MLLPVTLQPSQSAHWELAVENHRDMNGYAGRFMGDLGDWKYDIPSGKLSHDYGKSPFQWEHPL